MASNLDSQQTAEPRLNFIPSALFIVRLIATALLVTGAISKLIRFTEIAAGDGLLRDPWLLRLAIGMEGGFAFVVLTAPAVISRAMIVGVFGIFACVSGYAVVTGTDCNCIAKSISTSFMFVIDVLVVVAAVFSPVHRSTQFPVNARPVGKVIINGLCVAGLFFAVAFWRNAVPEIDSTDGAAPAYLLADSMIEQRWPIDHRYHPELKELESGNWLVLIVRSDCRHCEELVSTHFRDPNRRLENRRTAVFVAGSNSWPFSLDSVSMNPKRGTEVQWPSEEPFVASPAVFQLRDGLVELAADGDESDAMLQRITSFP